MPLFAKCTGHRPSTARKVFASVKPAGVGLVLVGVFVRPVSVTGAVLLALVCGYYLVGLASPARRDGSGAAAFTVFGAWAVGLRVSQLLAEGLR